MITLRHGEKIAEIWADLLRRVLVEPHLEEPVNELPASVIAMLIGEIERLHL